MLASKVDAYNGIIVDHKQLGDSEIQFGRALEASITQWREDGRKGVWLHIPKEKSHFIPIAIELGFSFHYCSPSVIVLTKWLPKTPSTLPMAPSHFVGVGGVVINENEEVLVVKEKKWTSHTNMEDTWRTSRIWRRCGESCRSWNSRRNRNYHYISSSTEYKGTPQQSIWQDWLVLDMLAKTPYTRNTYSRIWDCRREVDEGV